MMSGCLILVLLVVEFVDIRILIKVGRLLIYFNDCFNFNVLI